jgi:hypothetical protein
MVRRVGGSHNFVRAVQIGPVHRPHLPFAGIGMHRRAPRRESDSHASTPRTARDALHLEVHELDVQGLARA